MLFKFPHIAIMMSVACLSGCATMGVLVEGDRYWGSAAAPTRQASAYAWHLAGIMHERRGENEKAFAAWEQVSNLDNTALAPRVCMMRSYVRRGEYEEALRLCEEALQHGPDVAELWVAYGELNHRQGNIETAIEAFKTAIELRPDDLLGYGALVELQENTNDLIAAIDIYERLIMRSPDSAALYYQLGVNLVRIGDKRYASEVLKKVLALEPRITRARFLFSLTLYELGKFEDSAEQMRLYLVERPGDATALEYRAGALYRLGRIGEARAVFEQLLASGEATPRHFVQMSWLLFTQHDIERAQQLALEGGAYLLADIFFTLSQLDASARDTQSAPTWDDRFSLDEIETESDLTINALFPLFGCERVSATLMHRVKTLAEYVGFSPALTFMLARFYLFLDQPEEALPLLDALRGHGVVSRFVHFHSAVAYEKLKDFHNAEYHLKTFLELQPDDPDVQNFLGFLYAEYNVKLDEAEALLHAALKADPENPYYLDSLGWIYYRQGKAELAAELIRRAIYAMDTDDAILRDHLGDIYLLKGDVERAVGEWKRALRLDPTMDEVREKIERYTREESSSE